MIVRVAIVITLPKLVRCPKVISSLSEPIPGLPCLAYTRIQLAQPVNVGERATLWVRDLVKAFVRTERARDDIESRGCKGGMQASFLQLFDQGRSKMRALYQLDTHRSEFTKLVKVVGRTHPRIDDVQVLSAHIIW